MSAVSRGTSARTQQQWLCLVGLVRRALPTRPAGDTLRALLSANVQKGGGREKAVGAEVAQSCAHLLAGQQGQETADVQTSSAEKQRRNCFSEGSLHFCLPLLLALPPHLPCSAQTGSPRVVVPSAQGSDTRCHREHVGLGERWLRSREMGDVTHPG